jgi:NADPH-dependent glutamate synthase beta subunit-like oxidoreductase
MKCTHLKIIEEMGIEVRYNESVGRAGGNGRRTFLARLCDEYDAVYLAIGPNSSDMPDLQLDPQGHLQINPQTFQTSLEKVFAGGDVLRVSVYERNRELHHSSVLSISDGRRAATSIDRFLQKVSLTVSRTNEGPYETRLYTNTARIPTQVSLVATASATHYTRTVAETEAARCIQCECLECVKACPYLEHYNGYPKKYIREVYNNVSFQKTGGNFRSLC